MEAIPYKLRLQLSDEIPQEGQRRVMARIPAFDAPEIDNSFSLSPAAERHCGAWCSIWRWGVSLRKRRLSFGNALRPGIWTSPSAMSWMTVAVTAAAGTPPPKSPGPSG